MVKRKLVEHCQVWGKFLGAEFQKPCRDLVWACNFVWLEALKLLKDTTICDINWTHTGYMTIGQFWLIGRIFFGENGGRLLVEDRAAGQVGKELFCVNKKSILVTFSVPIISLCEVKTLAFFAVSLPN